MYRTHGTTQYRKNINMQYDRLKLLNTTLELICNA